MRGDRVLLGPANWGPVAVRRQVLVLQDIAPLGPSGVLLALLRSRRAGPAADVGSTRCRRGCGLGVQPRRVAPRARRSGGQGGGSRVGSRPPHLRPGASNRHAGALRTLRRWSRHPQEPGVRATTLATRLARARSATGRDSARGGDGDTCGGRRCANPGSTWWSTRPTATGRALVAASVLVWPSHYEGFGLPLLEAAALGTPFVSTESGAAPQLARRPWQIQPLDDDAWRFAIGRRWLPTRRLQQSSRLRRAATHGIAQRVCSRRR